jgi:hypothetical protein
MMFCYDDEVFGLRVNFRAHQFTKLLTNLLLLTLFLSLFLWVAAGNKSSQGQTASAPNDGQIMPSIQLSNLLMLPNMG